MRLSIAAFAVALLAGGSAHASSFVTIETPIATESPSFVYATPPEPVTPVAAVKAEPSPALAQFNLPELDPLNMLAPGANSIVRLEPVSRSIIAVIAPQPAVSNEMVAAIDETPKPRHETIPMVMRGGIIGDLFAEPEIELGKALQDMPAAVAPVDATGRPLVPESATPPNGTPANGAPPNGQAAQNQPARTEPRPSKAATQ